MKNLNLKVDVTTNPVRRKRENGMALMIVLLLLLLVSAIGLGLMYMSSTESSINGNYRDSQLAFFAMRSGLEEVRERMRANTASPLTLPVTMPGTPNSILYVINPAGAADVVDPKTVGNTYFDDEFCHETFTGVALANPGTNVPCAVTPPAGSVSAYVNSVAPNSNTASALKFKWARLSLKENDTFANGVVASYVDSAQPAGTQICYQSLAGQEIPLSVVPGGPYASCTKAQQAGQDASPVYVVTSLAITPKGSRRMGQYEIAGMNVSAPPAALGMDGPAAVFNPTPSSANYFINGTDNATAGAGWGGPGNCTPSGTTVPAISTGDAAGATNIKGTIKRPANYTGSGPAPSVVNSGPTGTGAFGGAWSSPSALDTLVGSLAAVADQTYSCGIGAPCSPAGSVGTDANPQITYVDGDFNYGNASGAGVLIVTGTLSFTGNATFNGLILVIGQGAMSESGGGNGGFNGSVFLAKTRSSVAPYAELPAIPGLGTPTIAWNGGGKAFIQYNSCWAMIGNGVRYVPITTREEMY
jgi:hypothetical protein